MEAWRRCAALALLRRGGQSAERDVATLAVERHAPSSASIAIALPEFSLRLVRAIVNRFIHHISSNPDAVIAVVNCLIPNISSKSVQRPAQEQDRRQARS